MSSLLSAVDLVIIGTGLAGYNVAKEWRKLNPSSSLVMISQGQGGFYSKPQLSTALAAGKAPESLWVYDAQTMSEQLQATILPQVEVTSIDAEQKHVLCDTGQVVVYHKLVLAVGAKVIKPQLEGSAVDEVLSVNHLEDYTIFRDKLVGCKRVALLGAGLVASEFANDLVLSGHEVTVAAPSPWLLDTLVPEPVGRCLEQVLVAEGVNFHLGCWPKRVDRGPKGLCVSLDNGVSYHADVVLAAIGIVPKLRLAKQANLTTERGVVVDDSLQTSNPDIFALGDCAEIAGQVRQYIAPILHSARAIAKTLSGQSTAVQFPIMPIVVKTPSLRITVIAAHHGVAGTWGEATTEADGIQAVAYDEQQQACRVVLTGDKSRQRQAVMAQYFG